MSETNKNLNNEEVMEDREQPQAAEAETLLTSDTSTSPVELVVLEGSSGESGAQGAETSIKRARFAAFQQAATSGEQNSMDLLLDVRLDLTVEIGRTSVPVRDVLQLGPGSIVPLQKLSGEPVDVLINGKLIARGEVVVVDENFGVRITEMVDRAVSSAQAG